MPGGASGGRGSGKRPNSLDAKSGRPVVVVPGGFKAVPKQVSTI